MLVLAAIIGGGVVAFQRGWTVSFGGGSNEASSNRFKGATGVDIPIGPQPDFWWTRVSSSNATVDPDYLPGVPTGMRFTRVLVPTDLLYQPDSDELSGGSTRALDEVARQITNPTLEVIVACHASSDGPPSSRQPLSLRRANVLADALEKILGRPSGSIRRIGKGDSVKLPGVDPDTPTGRARHRRCEVFVEAQ